MIISLWIIRPLAITCSDEKMVFTAPLIVRFASTPVGVSPGCAVTPLPRPLWGSITSPHPVLTERNKRVDQLIRLLVRDGGQVTIGPQTLAVCPGSSPVSPQWNNFVTSASAGRQSPATITALSTYHNITWHYVVCITVRKQADLLSWTQILGVPKTRTFVNPRPILRRLLNLPFHRDNPLAGCGVWPRCRCCPPTWTLSLPQSQPAARTEHCTMWSQSDTLFLTKTLIPKYCLTCCLHYTFWSL